MKARRIVVAGLCVVALAWQFHGAAQEPQRSSKGYPHFEVDRSWPTLPNNWVLGPTPAVAVDKHDNVWIFNRPQLLPDDFKSRGGPRVIQLDPNGKFINGWGGPGAGYEWFELEHDIFVDHKDVVWLGGAGPPGVEPGLDHHLLKFDPRGTFLMQIGKKGGTRGNKDSRNFNKPADIFVYEKTNEAFVADGYGNRRVVVLDADTGAFKRMWGAFGRPPEDPEPPSPGAPGAPRKPLETSGPGPQQFAAVHAVRVSNDDLVYVGDRPNRRIQVFTLDGTYVKQGFINREGPTDLTVAGIVFSTDPKQTFMYVVDYGNRRVVVLDRDTLEVLYQFGGAGAAPGQLRGAHHLAIDSKGNLYVAENPGNRVQKFVFTGVYPDLPKNALDLSQLTPSR